MGRFTQHLGEGEEITITYASGKEETLKLKPLGWEYVNDLVIIGKNFSTGDIDKGIENLSDDMINRMKKVILATMKLSYPEELEEDLKSFSAKNFLTLLPLIMDLNFEVASNEKLEQLKEKMAKMNAGKVQANQKTS